MSIMHYSLHQFALHRLNIIEIERSVVLILIDLACVVVVGRSSADLLTV